ncbi:RNA polymerase sigma-70 factor [Alistipes senegalensis]|uniref:RNA polymerase sigma-70 factor n=1 Tax=Alistipes senegalensis TaxID=1288121 RepID=UPI0018A9597C|nr:RNA polymerase sigma-70 factor [Alistipes senegalensis]MDY4569175.1 RNA polymerase sigma-70 factor [Alistipes senegalensis]
MTTDARLLERLSRGEQDAYKEVFMRYYGKVFRFIAAILRGRAVAEDLAQNVFLKVWANRHGLDSVRSLDGYLFTVARNETCDYLRRNRSSLKYRLTELSHSEQICDLSFDYDAERMERTVAVTVDRMPPQRQMVYRLSREEHLSNLEIAERLNLSKRTVDRHLSLALDDIRRAISPLVSGVTLFFLSHWV